LGIWGFLFALITWIVSAFIAYKIHGSPFSTVSSEELLAWGAIDGGALKSWEVWRIFTSQVIHSKQAHMNFNVILGYILGLVIEQRLGSLRFAAMYWLSGVFGILASVWFYPEYVSSGSSQALMGLSASILILRWREFDIQKWALFVSGMTLTIQLTLDIYVNNFPKAGHVAGFITGAILCGFFSLSKISRLSPA
jgi:rhomboid protease GluP